MKRAASALVGALCALVVSGGPAAAEGFSTPGAVGVDVSYPNCAVTASLSPVAFGVVGVTGGTAYTANPCLAAEAATFTDLSLYVNTGWFARSVHVSATAPRRCAGADAVCLAYNYGYSAGLDALAVASRAGVHSTTWWLDVELGNTWNLKAPLQNRASLQGEYDVLRQHGVTRVGAYSTTVQWSTITGGWISGWPGWGATKLTSAAAAATYCTGHRFTGGQTWLIQFRSPASAVDENVACFVASVASAPHGVLAGPRNAAAAVSWLGPLSTGGAAVSGYVVTASPGGRRCSTTGARTCTVTGLVNRVAYRFTVRAVNVAGAGPSSLASGVIIAGTTTAPRKLAVVSPRAGTVTAAWIAPAVLGTGPVTAYQVRWTANGITWTAWTRVGLRRSVTRLGFVQGHAYRVQVRALNTCGAGAVATLSFTQRR